jgi:hypothetical protein
VVTTHRRGRAMTGTRWRRIAGAAVVLIAALAQLGSFARAQDPVAQLKELLGKNDKPPEAVDTALKGAIAAAAAEAVPVVFAGIDDLCEQLSKHEVDAARSKVSLAGKKDDAKATDDARAALDKAMGSSSGPQRTLDLLADGMPKLLDAIGAKASGAAVPTLLQSYESETRRVDELSKEDEKLKGKLAQASSKLFTAEQDKEHPDAAQIAAADKAELQAKVDRNGLALALHQKLRVKLSDVVGLLLRTAKGPEVDAGLKTLDKKVDGKAPAAERAVWIDLYARLGRETIPAELIDAAQRASKEAKRNEDELGKQRDKYEKAKEAYFKSVNLKAGTVDARTQASFEALQKQMQEAAKGQREMEELRGAASRAVGIAASLLPADKKSKAVKDLLAELAGEKDLEIRCGLLEGSGAVDDPALREQLRKTLVDDKEVKARLAALEALVAQQDADAMEVVRARLLIHENWRVRVAAVAALLRVPQKESVPALIRALSVENGRVKEDITDALQQLTGQTYAMAPEPWQKWWDEQGASFHIDPNRKPHAQPVAAWDRKGEGKVTFYGITSISKRVCFVLDVSLSMQEDSGGRGEKRKIDIAKEQLKQAITGLADDDQFMIIVFAESVARWQPKLTAATPANKQKVTAWIDDKLELGPGTNIHAGMKEAFQVAGLGSKDVGYQSQIDTIFFLSDGDATVGEVLDPLELRREIREWNKLSRIRIHTIGVGEAPNIALLYGIAEDAGGQFQKR